MPITFGNLNLVYSVYVPLAIAALVGFVIFFSARNHMQRHRLAIILMIALPLVAGIFSFLLGYKTPLGFGVSAIVPYWHTIWFFVSFPASIVLGLIFAVFAFKSEP